METRSEVFIDPNKHKTRGTACDVDLKEKGMYAS